MKRIFTIILLLIGLAVQAQTFNPTGPGWKYTPKIQTENIQVRDTLKLNGEAVRITGATDNQILQRKTVGGKPIWKNVDANLDTLKADWNVTDTHASNYIKNKPVFEAQYTVLITQTGTSNPSVITLKNTIGSIVVTRTGVGTYALTLSGAFVNDKTTPVDDIMMDQYGNMVTLNRISANVMELKSYAASDLANPADGILTKRYINITVYP